MYKIEERKSCKNYFGEILLWTGIFVLSTSEISNMREFFVLSLSPILVAVLLLRVSGVPLLEAHAEKQWGNSIEYQEYKRNTPVLIPNIFKKFNLNQRIEKEEKKKSK